ncbi:beta-1,6-N-acetylglucosaminyltransferase, partial [Rodentibacter pneumotropicus]
MKKIFSIICHEITNSLEFTVNYLSKDKNSIVLIHVDKKSDISTFLHLEGENVLLVKERVNVTWGHISVADAVLALFYESMKYNYDYFFLLSGNDILIKPLEDLDNFLQDNKGKEFIHYQDDRDVYIDPVERVKYIYPDCFYSS